MTDRQAKDLGLLIVLRWDCLSGPRPHPVEICQCGRCCQWRAQFPGSGFRAMWLVLIAMPRYRWWGSIVSLLNIASLIAAIVATGIATLNSLALTAVLAFVHAIAAGYGVWRSTRRPA